MGIELTVCKTALTVALEAIAGAIVAAATPEAIAGVGGIGAIAEALDKAGIHVGGKAISTWLSEAVAAGHHTAEAIAEYVCEKAGA